MGKRGQVTLFIIVGILMLVVFFLLTRFLQGVDTQVIPEDFAPVTNFVESCIGFVGADAIEFVSQQGGYFEMEEEYTYYFYESSNQMPSKSTVEEELSKYMDEVLFFCLKNFADFPGFAVNQGFSKTKAIIRRDDVLFEVELPLEIRKQASKINLDRFAKAVPSRLNTLYDVSANIVIEQMKDPDSICLDCMVNLGINNDVFIKLERIDETRILFIVTDIIDLSEFIFANKYRQVSCDEVPLDWEPERRAEYLQECLTSQVEEKYLFELEEIQDMTAKVGEEFRYQVMAQGTDVVYEDYTYLFDISTEGWIIFTPTETGEHNIWIKVTDLIGNEDYSSFKLTIE